MKILSIARKPTDLLSTLTHKKVILVALVLIMATVIAGCTVTSSASSDMATTEAELPLVSELVAGTFSLEDTELAVDAEQASTLRSLWMAYISLSSDDAASSVELAALVEQVQENMTEEQIEAIEAMDLTQEDLMALSEELGLEMGGGMSSDADSEERAAMREEMAQGQITGQRPEGMVEGMGAPAASDGNASEEDMAAMRSQMQSRMVTPLIEALVEMLAAIA